MNFLLSMAGEEGTYFSGLLPNRGGFAGVDGDNEDELICSEP